MSLRTETLREGRVERVILARPKANVLDGAMLAALRGHIEALRCKDDLALVVFEGEGGHFSFGASVEEHLPQQVGELLGAFHHLFREIEALGVPTAAVVRGQCLGGGLELAMVCGRVFCAPDARLAVPEVQLGVFPPVAAALLPLRVGLSEATRLVLGGGALSGEQAVAVGLADVCDPDPEAALWAWFDQDLAPRSTVALRHAWRAVRHPVRRALHEELPSLERLYLEELMAHHDPVEGLTSFLERRPPVWRHR